MLGVWKWGNRVNLLFLTAMGGVCFVLILLVFNSANSSILALLGFGMLVITSRVYLNHAQLAGLRQVIRAKLPNDIFRIAILIVAVGTFYVIGFELSASYALGAHILALLIAFFIGLYFKQKALPNAFRGGEKYFPKYKNLYWLKAAVPIALTNGMLQINKLTDGIMLGTFGTMSEVGVYRVAIQATLVILLGEQTARSFVLPYFASLHQQGKYIELRKLFHNCRLTAFSFALLCLLILIFLGEFLVEFVFGKEYLAAYLPILILAGAQTISSFLGIGDALLNMTGFEKSVMKGGLVALVINVTLNYLLIPIYGSVGAAFATGLSIVIWNLTLVFFVQKKLRFFRS